MVKALLEVDDHRDEVKHMNPEGLSISDGVILTQILHSVRKRHREHEWLEMTQLTR